MNATLAIITGITLLTVVGIVSGGIFLLRVVSGATGTNDLQKTFFRAGHAHAGVLVTLGLVVALLTHATGANTGWSLAGSILVLASAILIPSGFFLSVLGTDPQQPGPMVASLWLGALSLVVGLVISGVVVIAAGVAAL